MIVLMILGCFQYRLDPSLLEQSDTASRNIDVSALYDIQFIASGVFTMGCTPEQGSSCDSNESPVHEVVLTNDFYMMETEVTQELWSAVIGNNPSHFSDCGDSCPVENVSWYDVVDFANRLSEREGLGKCYTIDEDNVQWSDKNCLGWTLPTEAEWEYAARGGENFKYAGSDNPDDVAWYEDGDMPHAVGEKMPNDFGLYDMSGNVYEWTWDRYTFYSNEPQTDPTGDNWSSERIKRGGVYFGNDWVLRVSCRQEDNPNYPSQHIGFRLRRLVE